MYKLSHGIFKTTGKTDGFARRGTFEVRTISKVKPQLATTQLEMNPFLLNELRTVMKQARTTRYFISHVDLSSRHKRSDVQVMMVDKSAW